MPPEGPSGSTPTQGEGIRTTFPNDSEEGSASPSLNKPNGSLPDPELELEGSAWLRKPTLIQHHGIRGIAQAQHGLGP